MELGYFIFVSLYVRLIVVYGGFVFVVNMLSDILDVIDVVNCQVVVCVYVGVDLVSVVVCFDGWEVWVLNYVFDFVSVIDSDLLSLMYLQVVVIVQEFDCEWKVMSFDELMGIVFVNNQKVYVVFFLDNQIVVVDVGLCQVGKWLIIIVQDFCVIVVCGNWFYVLLFELNNKIQFFGGVKEDIDGDLVMFDVFVYLIQNNSKLLFGYVFDIIKYLKMFDCDFYVFDMIIDDFVEMVDILGMLFYGLMVDLQGCVFIVQMDVCNYVNGCFGIKKYGFVEMMNCVFLNQVICVVFGDEGVEQFIFFDFELVLFVQFELVQVLVIFYVVEVSDDDLIFFVLFVGLDKLVILDVDSGEIFGCVDVDVVLCGIVFVSVDDGWFLQVWVFNVVENMVLFVDVVDVVNFEVVEMVMLEDLSYLMIK